MKKFLFLLSFIFISFLLVSCEKKEENPTGPGVQFNLEPQLNKIYYFQRWLLDSLDQKKDGPFYFNERCAAKNVIIGGKNDAFLSIRSYNEYKKDSTFYRVENGKDVYVWMDILGIFNEDSKSNLKFLLNKIAQSYEWVPRFLISKGDGAEYVLLPKRIHTMMIDTNRVNIIFDMSAKNEGFETIQVPAGSFKAYKVKITLKFEVYIGTQKEDTINFLQYVWISDDLDWRIKSYFPTVRSSKFGVVSTGQIDELIATY